METNSPRVLHYYDWIFLDLGRHFPGEALQFYEHITAAGLLVSLTWLREVTLDDALRGA